MTTAFKISLPVDDEAHGEGHIGISEMEDVASYNWLDKPTPTILVPGIPPVWQIPFVTPQLKPDTGVRYVDQNVDRNPWSPLEPLVRAVTATYPDFKFNELDVVTDRRPVRHLLEFVAGTAEGFQFAVEVLGGVAFITRMEKQTRETIPPGMFQGYRRAFEECYTKIPRSAQGSTSHHRVVRYRLGGLQLLVRSAVDAYLQKEVAKSLPSRKNLAQDDLVSCMKAASVGTDAPSVQDTPEAPGVKVVHGGEQIAHSALLELTTRSKFAKKPFDIQNKLPDLWLSQTPHYIVAFHQNVGTKWSRQMDGLPRLAEFKDIEIMNMMEGKLQSWEDNNQASIRKLVVVLRQVLKEARAMGAPCIVNYSQDEGCLLMSKLDKGTFAGLPEDLEGKLLGKA